MIGQAGSIGRKSIKKVEVEQKEQEYSGKQEVPSAIPAQNTEKQDVTFQAVKGTEICA